MQKPVKKSIFPLWTKIAICILCLLAIITIILLIKESVVIIATIVAIIIATANIVLVFITRNYADQTKKMVDQHNKEWRLDLRPLFVPLGDKLDDNDNMTFKFINLGNLALFFNIKNVEQNRERKLPAVSTEENVSITITNVTKIIVKGVMNRKNRTDPTILTFIITFQDKVANKYTQTINYHFTEEKWQFIFEDSCFPEPIKKEKV